MKIPLFKYCVILALSLGLLPHLVNAQQKEESRIIQVSGLVMNADSTYTIPGVHIFDPYRGRGTNTDFKGWFSKAFLAGDSLVISAVGFRNRRVRIPTDIGDRWTVVFALEEEITQLQDLEVKPFPSEELFKEAILAMSLTDVQENVLNSFEPEIIQELVRSTPIKGSPALNYRYMLNQQFMNLQNNAGPRANPLLNPFAWAQFIKSFKRKKKKKKR